MRARRPPGRRRPAAGHHRAAGLAASVVACAAPSCIVACGGAGGDPAPRIEAALERAAAYLISRQSPEGSWRSQTYGTLSDGPTLTPVVLKTVLLGPPGDRARSAFERGARYLTRLADAYGGRDPPGTLDFPVYTAATSVIVLTRWIESAPPDADAARPARDAWIECLLGHQLSEDLGWSPQDPAFGGWGYSVRPPKRPQPPAAQNPFESDLSSTLFALGALRIGGLAPDHPALRRAEVFVTRCQNLPCEGPPDPSYDDGGFFFAPSRSAQNKAGSAGVDREGRLRFRSYGSATADGLRALLRCGFPPDHPRVVAAAAWLRSHFSTRTNPGEFEPGLAPDRDGGFFYYCWSVTHAFRALGVETVDGGAGEVPWAPRLAEALLARQRADGSWANPQGFLKEDDPLVATSLAAAALENCRRVMAAPVAAAPRGGD